LDLSSKGDSKRRYFMENQNSEVLVNVQAVPLDDGTMFHAKVIGLPYFRVPLKRVLKSEFALASNQQELTI
jgi:hypothetical protein